MKQSQLFTKTQKDAPKDELSKNAQLLIRAGYVHKEMAGVYSFLPLGLTVLNKINAIIREEMNAIGGQELRMSALQSNDSWTKTNRINEIDVWFKTQLQSGTELLLAPTHEEPLTHALTNYVSSYKDLPFYAYQIQTKFRNELRSKSGIMRGREFLMKDLYSFSRDEKQHDEFYEISKQAYTNVFDRLGLGDRTFITFASGGSFSKYSHEFQTIAEVGEDTIYVSRDKQIAVNQEVYTDEVLKDLGLNKDELEEVRAVEVGNIFSLGTKFSDALGLQFTDEDGTLKPVIMGSYGIGPTRLMGTIVELLSDEQGIVWPEAIAPYRVHIISLGQDEEATKIYNKLVAQKVEVLFDDRDTRAGEKFADSDLLGIPHRITVSSRSLENGGYEYKKRTEKEGVIKTEAEVLAMFS